jgi:hypothetical protein
MLREIGRLYRAIRSAERRIRLNREELRRLLAAAAAREKRRAASKRGRR